PARRPRQSCCRQRFVAPGEGYYRRRTANQTLQRRRQKRTTPSRRLSRYWSWLLGQDRSSHTYQRYVRRILLLGEPKENDLASRLFSRAIPVFQTFSCQKCHN